MAFLSYHYSSVTTDYFGVFRNATIKSGSVELAPNMEHKNAGDKQERHDQHGHGADLDAGRVVGVEPPHASRAGAAGTSGHL